MRPRGVFDSSLSTDSHVLLSEGARLPENLKATGIEGDSQIETRPLPRSGGFTQLMRKHSCCRSFIEIATFRCASVRSSNSYSCVPP